MIFKTDPFSPFNISNMSNVIEEVTNMIDQIFNSVMVNIIEETGKSFETKDVVEYHWVKINMMFMQAALDWCYETFGGMPDNCDDHIYFANEDEYTMFILRWGK